MEHSFSQPALVSLLVLSSVAQVSAEQHGNQLEYWWRLERKYMNATPLTI